MLACRESSQVLPLIDAVVALLAQPEHLPVVPAREIPSAQARSPQPARSVVRVAASLAATSAADVAATVQPPGAAASATASATAPPTYVRVRPASEFLLAFARRNVPIDRVLAATEAAGLAVEILSPGLHGVEPVYSFRCARLSVCRSWGVFRAQRRFIRALPGGPSVQMEVEGANETAVAAVALDDRDGAQIRVTDAPHASRGNHGIIYDRNVH